MASFWHLWRRYRVVIIFPTLAGSAIYADLRHTRQWKKQLVHLGNAK